MSTTPSSTQAGISLPGGHVVSGPEPPRGRPSIAIVAVHGVADQQPHESAGAIANLLLRIRRRGASAYTSFRELPLRIPTAPVKLEDHEGPTEARRRGYSMEERPEYLRARMDAAPGTAAAADTATPPDHEFMRSLLVKYPGSGEPYETIRLEGQRLGPDGTPAADVHVYEMYWADLSRLGAGIFRIFGELYQLLLHLANLGRVVVNHASLEHPGSRAWRWYAWVESAAVRLLTLFTPVLGMLMLGTLGTLLPGVLRDGWKRGIAIAVLGAGAGGAAGCAASRRRARPPVPLWALLPFAAAGAGALAAWGLLDGAGLGVESLLALEWLALSAAGLDALFAAYGRRRPGAQFYGRVFLGVSFVVLGIAIAARSERYDIAAAALRTFEVQYLVLAGSWIAMAACALAAGVTGHVLQARQQEEGKRRRARRAAWTARTTLALSAASIFLLSLLLFGALRVPLSRVLVPLQKDHPEDYRPLLAYQELESSTSYGLDAVLENLLLASATSGLPVLLVCLGLTMVLAVWAILPPALTEVSAPADASPAWRDTNSALTREERWAKAHDDGERSERLGTWLSRGFPTLAAAATLLWVALFVLMPATSVARAVTQIQALDWLALTADWFLGVLGSAIAAAAVGLLALRGRFDVLGMGLRPALDVMLDVDNYLREHPRDQTPRARIAERYTSLLRYLSLWRNERRECYAAVIFVSHSQGTVITADLLGFLQREQPQGMDDLIPGTPRDGRQGAGRIRMYLFTMGSPLRQLYGRAFPHLYAWVSGRPKTGFGDELHSLPTGAAGDGAGAEHGHVVADVLEPDASPDPSQVGLTRWVNAYRSGDYVGRELWRKDACGCLHRRIFGPADPVADPPALVVSEDAARLRRELCIGGGAHTHYWDETAPAIGAEVDLLVADVLQRVRSAAPAGAPPSP